jgi:hypothetical protein
VKPSDGLEPSTPSLPWNVSRNWWQPVATNLAYLCGFGTSRFAADCHRLQPRGSIKAPSSVVGFGRVGGCSASIFARRLARPGSQRHADLAVVAKWVDDPAEHQFLDRQRRRDSPDQEWPCRARSVARKLGLARSASAACSCGQPRSSLLALARRRYGGAATVVATKRATKPASLSGATGRYLIKSGQ